MRDAATLFLGYAGFQSALLLLVVTNPQAFAYVNISLGLLGVSIPATISAVFILGIPTAIEHKPARLSVALCALGSLFIGVLTTSLLFSKLSIFFSYLFPIASATAFYFVRKLFPSQPVGDRHKKSHNDTAYPK
jgi:hypothetical protein